MRKNRTTSTRKTNVNEKSVYLEDLKDANKSNSTKKAQVAVSNYKKWHKS